MSLSAPINITAQMHLKHKNRKSATMIVNVVCHKWRFLHRVYACAVSCVAASCVSCLICSSIAYVLISAFLWVTVALMQESDSGALVN